MHNFKMSSQSDPFVILMVVPAREHAQGQMQAHVWCYMFAICLPCLQLIS